MSLVGPRPPLPDEVATYTPHELQRLSVTPGLTCIWQVSPLEYPVRPLGRSRPAYIDRSQHLPGLEAPAANHPGRPDLDER
ncbi:MAG: sugar transferase [Thermomicrobiales bacterium]